MDSKYTEYIDTYIRSSILIISYIRIAQHSILEITVMVTVKTIMVIIFLTDRSCIINKINVI